MIALQSGCLLFQLINGESVPCSAEMISIEVTGDSHPAIDPEMLRHAAASVFHYFKIELEREVVTVGEFAQALEKVLRHLGLTLYADPAGAPVATPEADLDLIVRGSTGDLDLFFYPKLRDELRAQLRQSPRVLRFRGLRNCVKQLAHAKRWSSRCEKIQDQIIGYLRECLVAEPQKSECALVVE
jgi:hypothetical protein